MEMWEGDCEEGRMGRRHRKGLQGEWIWGQGKGHLGKGFEEGL